ncbi:MAG: ATP-binding protein [Acidimicrobiales bacterium]
MPIGSRSAGTSTRRAPAAKAASDAALFPAQPVGAWRRLAELLLQREVLAARVRRGGPVALAAEPARGPEVDRLVESLLLDGTGGSLDDTLAARRRRLDEVDAGFADPVASARRALDDELSGDGVFAILAANAGLDRKAAEMLGLLVAVELDLSLQRLAAWLHDGAPSRRLTLGLLTRLTGSPPATGAGDDGTGLAAVAPEGALVRAGYVTVDDDGPWADRTVAVEPAVIWALLGDRSRDPDLPAELDIHLAAEPGDRRLRLVAVHGGDRWRRRQTGADAAGATRYLVAAAPATERAWRALVREATIRGCGVVLEVDRPGDAGTAWGGALGPEARRWLERASHVVWVLSSTAQLPLDSLPRRPWRELEASDEPAGPDEWAELLPGAEVGRHPLSADQIRQVSRAYGAVGGDLDAAVRRLASGAIDRLARRVRPRRTWDDLVLPAGRRAELAEVVSRYRHRALVHGTWGYRLGQANGVVALFHGPSGTGKTLSAEIIAHDLGLDLFTIDLSAMVSKYIGETEKNLEEVFDAASAANVVLLFDEADSLFGKRSEVNEAKDRYANIEVSYLLQRIERYEGIAILTTNLLKNIDQAFLRRIDVLAEFALPEPDERLALWRLGFPPTAPLGADVDLEALADRFKLAGGNIHSVCLTAAFLAAEAGGVITMTEVVEGLKREYAKLGRLRTTEEFGPWLS